MTSFFGIIGKLLLRVDLKKYLYNCKSIKKKPNLDEFIIKIFKQCWIEIGGKSY